jgi:hypothetical protein
MPLHLVGKGKGLDTGGFTKREENMIRRIHINLLTKLPEHKAMPWPNPMLVKEPNYVSPLALTFQPTKRLQLLSQPMARMLSSRYAPILPKEHYVESYCLNYVPTPRLITLSVPKKIHSRPSDPPKSRKRLAREKLFSKRRAQWLQANAMPRKPPKPRKIYKKKRKVKISETEIMMRIEELSRPARIYEKDDFDPFTVSPLAIKAKASERTVTLAQPRTLNEETVLDIQFNPYKISKGALHYKPSPRVLELSAPHVRTKQVDMDVKEDAFSVPRRALKAICTKRTKELAKPIER